ELLGLPSLPGAARAYYSGEHVVHAHLRVSPGDVEHGATVAQLVAAGRAGVGKVIVVHLVFEVDLLVLTLDVETRGLTESAVDLQVATIAVVVDVDVLGR